MLEPSHVGAGQVPQADASHRRGVSCLRPGLGQSVLELCLPVLVQDLLRFNSASDAFGLLSEAKGKNEDSMMPQLVGDWGTPVSGSYKAATVIGPDVEVILLM